MHTPAEKTFVTVSNALELSTRVIRNVAGGVIADKLQNEVINNTTVARLCASVMTKKFGSYLMLNANKQ